MAVKLKKIADQVMVITGASSGIGLTTARMAAQRGARLMLIARNEGALRQLAHELHQHGKPMRYCVADVGDENDVRNAAQSTVQEFGGFDTWINDAGIGLYGKLLEVTTADHRRLFETNFWGTVYGSLEAARHLRQRGGAIINVGSEVSDRSLPILGMYAASKHAVKGFTDALRMELEAEGAPISVTLVKPSATDTPFPDHAKNYMDEEPALPEPIYAPEIVAEVILHCAQAPERDLYAGGTAKLHSLQEKFMPRVTDWIMERSLIPKMKSGRPANRADDALYGPTTGLRQRGQSPGRRRESSLYTRATMHPYVTALLMGGGALAATALARAAIAKQRRTHWKG
jgi:short-subunit dehydrogenase